MACNGLPRVQVVVARPLLRKCGEAPFTFRDRLRSVYLDSEHFEADEYSGGGAVYKIVQRLGRLGGGSENAAHLHVTRFAKSLQQHVDEYMALQDAKSTVCGVEDPGYDDDEVGGLGCPELLVIRADL